METWGVVLQSLINQVIKRSQHLQDRLEELESRRFASSQAPNFLIRLLNKANNNIWQLLMNFTQENFDISIDYEGFKNVFDYVKRFATFLDDLYQYIFFIEASSVEFNPPGITTAIEHIALQLNLPNTLVMICPSFVCNYEYYNLLSERNLRSGRFVPKILPYSIFEGRNNLAALTYPQIIRNDTLSHALLLHELGHLFDEVYNISENVLKDRIFEPPLKESEKLGMMLKEYISDIFAVSIIGPAYLLALIEFLSTVGLPSETQNDHPPLLLRIRNSIDTIQHYQQSFYDFRKTSKSFEAIIGIYLEGLDNFTKLENIPISEEIKNIYKVLEPSLVIARDIIKRQIPLKLQFIPSLQLFEKYVDKCVKEGIPPSAWKDNINEDIIIPNLGEILNAIFIYQFGGLKFGKPKLLSRKYSIKLRKISRLTQLAIRQNEMVRRYLGL